ncbi:MAG: alpha-amylase [Polyangiaceae bacterium]|nr:alpha-amylase [Polyangiaceae bacterium]
MKRSFAALWLAAAWAGGCGGDPPAAEPGGFAEKNWPAEAEALLAGSDWYRHAVFYEVYVRSFQDSDGDGVGDLKGLESRLDYLKELGVDALWLMPILETPFFDSGYDVADYLAVNPDYGTEEDLESLLDAAHARGMRVIMDLVLNHTSAAHSWFVESRADRTNAKADWYVWSDTPSHPDNGCGTQSGVFGDSAWEYDAGRGQYYFHRFYPEQPDLNYRSPAVVEATLGVARHWLDRGVDGFRCDVIGLLHESATECEMLPATVDYIRELRAVVDEYPGSVLVAEPSKLTDATAYFGDGADMFHMAFHFGYGYFWGFPFGAGSAAPITDTFAASLERFPVGAQDALVIGSHDVARAYAVAQGDDTRHRRAAWIQLTARGTPYVYYGEELALRPGTDEVVDLRDTARTPMLWDGTPGHGFTTGTPWLAFGAEADTFHLAAEREDPTSMWAFYRDLLRLRRGRAVWGTGEMELLETGTTTVFAFHRADAFMAYVVAVNLTPDEVTARLARADLGERAERVIGSGTLALDASGADLVLPGAGAAVFRVR